MNYQQQKSQKITNLNQQGGNTTTSPQFSWLKINWYYLPLSVFLIIGLAGCVFRSPTNNQTNSDAGRQDSNLTFFDVILEQADEVGRPVWRVKAKQAEYTKEKQIGEALNPYGELYQDGKVVYQVKAEKADIEQDGKQLFLKGKIVATDPANGIILRGNELEWRPQEDLLIVRNQINGTHKQLQAIAQEAKVKTREQRMEFSGGVVATSADPQMKIRTEHLIWQIKTETLTSDRPIQIDRYKNNQVSDRAKGNSAQVNLKTKIATLEKNAQLDLLEPPMQISSNSMTWNINRENVNTNSPVRVFHKAENLTVTAKQGEMQIAQRIVYLTGNVNAIGQRLQTLNAQKMTWYLDKKLLAAQGNVAYQQVDPPLNFKGETAVGNLQTENIVVKGGGSGNRVVTEIIPKARD